MATKNENMTKKEYNLVFSERVKYQKDLKCYRLVVTTAHTFLK